MNESEALPAMTPTGAPAAPIIDSESIVRLVATAMVQLSQQRGPSKTIYPDVVQKALNQVVLLALERGDSPPQSVADLVRWAQRPLGEWPLDLPADLAADDTVLVDPETVTPTQRCLEWLIDAGDTLGELVENKVMLGALAKTQSAQAPDAYTEFRNLLITKPVLTQAEFLSITTINVELELLGEQIKYSYRPAPSSLRRHGTYHRCGRCNGLLVPVGNEGFRCELDRCRRDGVVVGDAIDPGRHQLVYQLLRPLRVFVTGPGLAETDLQTDLESLGLTVKMWPEFDNYDLQVIFGNGTVWAIDVKDYANPALLARRATPLRKQPHYDRAFLVIPQYRFDDRPDYRTVFHHHVDPKVRDQLELVTDTEVVAAAKKQLGTHTTRRFDRKER
ncbi:hypothetical protein ACFWPH_32770 [Nocardia sp. NPDC058499]|uniref:pPIWI_RE_Y domain-containing protein n=1 Tax=Nocardia sp. NPDC058499 TaxID=3346530 RepID=UPI003657657C